MKLNEDLNLVDLGQDFFLINFQHHENYSKAISNHFLAIRQW